MPEAFKSNNPGYIRGKVKHGINNPGGVELSQFSITIILLFNTSGVVRLHHAITTDVTVAIGF